MFTDILKKLLQNKKFVYIASVSPKGQPNVAPKFVVKVENNFLYLVDYVIGSTWANIRTNPRVAVSFMDNEDMTGYQLKGSVTLLNSGAEFDAIINELKGKQVALTVERVIEGIQRGKRHKNFEVALPENGVIFKIKIEELVEIGPSGGLRKEKIEGPQP